MRAVLPDATSDEVVVTKPDRAPLRFYGVLTIGVDLDDAGEIYIARFLPRASVTDKGDQAFTNSGSSKLNGASRRAVCRLLVAARACRVGFGPVSLPGCAAQPGTG